MTKPRVPQYIIDVLERLERRAVRMDGLHFGHPSTRLVITEPGEDARATSVDEVIKSKTKNYREQLIEPDLALVLKWARGEKIEHLDREGAR